MAESKSKVDFPCKAPRLLQVRLPLDQAKMPTQRTTTLEHTGYKNIYIYIYIYTKKTNIHGTKALIEKNRPTSSNIAISDFLGPLSSFIQSQIQQKISSRKQWPLPKPSSSMWSVSPAPPNPPRARAR